MKECSKCKIEKLFSEFHLDKKNLDGHTGVCKTCVSARRIMQIRLKH